jgi:hypothetical protein
LCLNHELKKSVSQLFVGTGFGDHEVIDPAGGVFLGDGLGDGKVGLAELVGHKWPAHGSNDFVILKEIGELAAGGPEFADVGFQSKELLFDCCELLVREIVELRGIGLVVAEHLRSHI